MLDRTTIIVDHDLIVNVPGNCMCICRILRKQIPHNDDCSIENPDGSVLKELPYVRALSWRGYSELSVRYGCRGSL